MEPCVKLESSAFVADRELIEALEQHSTTIICDEDRLLFNQGDDPSGLYILHHGDATLTMHSPNGDQALCMTTSGDSLLGLPALVGHEPYSLSAKARKGSDLSFVSREDFDELMQTMPSLPLKILHVLAAEVRAARQALL
jgi:CRP-like cAMP-binding protein